MPHLIKYLMDLLKNPSVAAFVGAFSAFFLVALTDWRRKHRKKGLIKKRINILKEIAIAKRESAQTNIQMIQSNRFSPAPIMPFPIDDLRVLQRETLDILSSAQINAIDALIYWMESIDGIFERARLMAEELEHMSKQNTPNEVKSAKGQDMLKEFSIVVTNINHFENMANLYINDNPDKILEYKVEHK